ncbi:MAG: hypothetical protein FD123_1187 [Bacteroidetes bacterium]|nr:MAG: hypothetical protein FD123_1187 [Bacteroidota bacterium]
MFRMRLAVIFLFSCVSAKAQFMDTLRVCINRKASLICFLDSRNSFISDRRANIWGVKIGAEFGGKLSFGGGWNMHTNNLTKEIFLPKAGGGLDSTEATLRFAYFSYFARYVYYQSKRWKFSVTPLQIGFGRSRYDYDYAGESFRTDKKTVIVYENNIAVSYRIFRWLGAGTDLGFRWMIRNNDAIPENFNSPIYSFYSIIYWGELYKMVFPGSKLAKRL